MRVENTCKGVNGFNASLDLCDKDWGAASVDVSCRADSLRDGVECSASCRPPRSCVDELRPVVGDGTDGSGRGLLLGTLDAPTCLSLRNSSATAVFRNCNSSIRASKACISCSSEVASDPKDDNCEIEDIDEKLVGLGFRNELEPSNSFDTGLDDAAFELLLV